MVLPLAAPSGATNQVREFIGPLGLSILATARHAVLAPYPVDSQILQPAPRQPDREQPDEARARAPAEAAAPATSMDERVNWQSGHRLSQRETEQLAAILLDDETYQFHSAKRCGFQPTCGFRLQSGQGSLTVMLCFGCTEVRLLVRDAAGRMQREVTEDFDYARPELLRMFQRYLPEFRLLADQTPWHSDISANLKTVAEQLAEWLTSEGEDALRFEGVAGDLHPTAGDFLNREVRQQLQAAGLQLSPRAPQELVLQFRLQNPAPPAPEPADDTPATNPVTGLLEGTVRSRSGRKLHSLQAVVLDDLTARVLHEGSPRVSWQQRVEQGRATAVSAAVRHGHPEIDGAKVRAGSGSPYTVRLIAGQDPWLRFVAVTQNRTGHLQASSRIAELDSINLGNRSPRNVVASLRLTGAGAVQFLSALPVLPAATRPGHSVEPGMAHLLIPAGRQLTVSVLRPAGNPQHLPGRAQPDPILPGPA
ncbi:MAG: hypothetical protein KDA79_24760, partial [Planctomycetaceae bacterium]|nr:hypothetical protein [Planctomycetaceae bacterium]